MQYFNKKDVNGNTLSPQETAYGDPQPHSILHKNKLLLGKY